MNLRTLEQPVADPVLDTRYRALLEHHRAPVTRLAGLYERDRTAWKGLVQDIRLAVWRALPRFRGDWSERTFTYLF
jgi:DNA-directed RNA polymerase specialized sigma24 family protein